MTISDVPELVRAFMTRCTMMEKKTMPDGQGGFTTQWTDGATFLAAIVKDQTLAARTAEKEGVTEVYTITAAKTAALDFHDVLRREEDGAVFRVTSNAADSRPPKIATFAFVQVTAERWNLT